MNIIEIINMCNWAIILGIFLRDGLLARCGPLIFNILLGITPLRYIVFTGGVARESVQQTEKRKVNKMNTQKLFTTLLVAFIAITLSTMSYAQENRILMTTAQQYQNMVPNASFESWDSTNTKPTDWTLISTPTLSQDTGVKRIGANGLKITSAIGATSMGVSYTITVEPRTTYTFSCYYYSAAANQAELEIDGNVTADLVNATGASALTSTSAAWKRYSAIFTTVTDTTVTIKLYAKADAAATKTAYFDAVSLTEGSMVPAFSPHTVSDTGNHTMYGNLTVEGTANLNGDVNLGNLSTDNITLKGTLKSLNNVDIDIQPQGTGKVSVTGNLTVVGTVTADGLTLGANENITLGTQTIKHDGTDFQFSDAIDLSTNVLDDTNLGYFLGWKHASDGSKMDGGDIYTGTVTTTQIGADTILAGDIATGAVATAEILDGTIAPADIGMIRTSAQGTPDKTVAIASGSVYVSGNTLISYAGGTGNFGSGGNLVYTPTATGKYVKALVTLNSAGNLSKTMGTEKALAADAEAEGITYPLDELPIVEVILKTTGVTAGDVANIEGAAGSLSYIYRDVRPFINLGMSSATTSTSFTIGSGTDESANDISLLFGNTTGGQQSLVYAGSGASAALDIFKLTDDLMLNSGATASTTDVVLTFGGTTSETITFDGDTTDNFVFSDIVDAEGYYVSGSQISTANLSDGANVAHINAAETVTGGWSFGTSATTFDSGATFNTDVDMVYAGTENLAITSAASSAVNAVTLDITSSNAGVVKGVYVTQNATSSQPVDVGLEIANLDADTAMATAIKVTPTGTITTGLDLGGTQIANSGNITGSGAMTVSSGATSDLGLTGTYGVNVTATAQDIALSATTATNGGVNIAGPSATIDVGVASDGVIDVDATSITIDKGAAGTLKLRSGTTDYFGLDANEAITIGDSGTPTALTVNASTIGLSPTGNVTLSLAATKSFAVNNASAQTIISMDNDTRTLSVYNLNVNGTTTTINTTTTDADHWAISPGAIGTTAIAIEPDATITLTGNLITAKKTNAGADVFVVDKDGNITTAGTYKGFTIAHSTHAQNTDTGTTGTGFTLASGTDAAANNVTLTFGGTNAETIIFDGATTDDFIFSDKIVATAFDAGSGGITNVGNISDDQNINMDLSGATDKTLAIQNSGAGLTNVTVDGSVTSASLAFDNTTLDSDTWTTGSTADITLTPAGNNILPGSDGTIDLGLIAAIESMSGAARDSGTGSLTLTTSGTWTTYVDNDLTYRVKIDGAGNVGIATSTWSRDGGSTWVATGVVTSGTATALENGLSIAFGGTGAVVNDYWDITITKNTGYKNLFANTVTTDKVYTPAITAENASGTVTLTGSLSISGDLNVTGQQNITGGTVYTGQEVVRLDHAQALLVEKAGAGGSGTDIFFVDTVDQNAELYSALGIGKSPASGVELDVLGDGAFSGTLSSTGNLTVNTNKFSVTATNGNTSVAGTLGVTGNVDVSSGLDVTGANLTLDTNDIVVNTNKFTVDGATGNTTSAGTLTSLSSIGIVPEYDNATPMGDTSDNFGTLSLKYGSAHNYYEWTTNEPTVQDYDIVLRYRLPDGFTSFDTTAPIKLWNDLSATPNAATLIKVQLLDTDGTTPLTIASTGGTYASNWLTLPQNTSWTQSTITITNSATELTSSDAGLYITLKIQLCAYQGDTVDVGEMTMKGNW